MTLEDKTLVQQSWAQVEPIAAQAAGLFYQTLFTLDPSLRPLFKGDMAEQGEKLMSMIGAAVGMLDRLDQLTPIMEKLGARHQDYGVKPDHYETVGAALLETLAIGLGDAFSPAVRRAWGNIYAGLSATMLNGARQLA
jgi:methyl-accepting chemotaxis protein